jgi:hypothetical protein
LLEMKKEPLVKVQWLLNISFEIQTAICISIIKRNGGNVNNENYKFFKYKRWSC